MRVEHEGGAAAWLVGTLVKPSVQGHGLLPLQELWPISLFFDPLEAGNQKASGQSFSITLPFQALRGSLAWGPSLLFGASGT